MQPDFLNVGRRFPQLATTSFRVDEHWSDRYRVSIRAAVRMVAAVRIERILNWKLVNRAVIGLGVGFMRVPSLAFVLGVEPASTTAIRTTVWHVRSPLNPTPRRGIKLLTSQFRIFRRNLSQFSVARYLTAPRQRLRCCQERPCKTPPRSRP